MTDTDPEQPSTWRTRLRRKSPLVGRIAQVARRFDAEDSTRAAVEGEPAPAPESAPASEPEVVEAAFVEEVTGQHFASDERPIRVEYVLRESRGSAPDFYLLVGAAVVGVLVLIVAIVVVVVAVTGGRTTGATLPTTTTLPALDRNATVFDDFDRNNADALGKPKAGLPWTFVGAEWGISGHQARIVKSADSRPTFALQIASSSDGSVQVALPKMGDSAGLVFRYRNLNNYWQLASAPKFGTFILSKAVDGNLTPVGNVGLVGTDDGTTIKVELDGPKITIVMNDVEVKTFTDPTLKDERIVGMMGLADNDLKVRFDNFVVIRPAPPASPTSAASATTATSPPATFPPAQPN